MMLGVAPVFCHTLPDTIFLVLLSSVLLCTITSIMITVSSNRSLTKNYIAPTFALQVVSFFQQRSMTTYFI